MNVEIHLFLREGQLYNIQWPQENYGVFHIIYFFFWYD